MNEKYRVEKDKLYNQIDYETQCYIKTNRLPLVCLITPIPKYPSDYKYIVFGKDNESKAKFINLVDAEEYAEFLSNK